LFGHYSETFNVKNVVIDDHVELETKYTYGAKWDGNILYISNNVTEDVIRYILAREAFFSVLPSKLKNINEIYDLAWEFALELLGHSDKWMNIWKKVSKKKRVSNIIYNPTKSFPIFYKITKGKFLSEIIDILLKPIQYAINLTSLDYFVMLEDYMMSKKYPFSQTQIKLIDIFLKDPEFDVKQVSRLTGISTNRIYREINYLIRNHIISKYYVVRHKLIDIKTYIMVLYHIPNYMKFLRKIKKLPFLFSVNPFIERDGGIVACFMIPKNLNNIRLIKQFYLEHQQPNSIFESVDNIVTNWNLSHYNPNYPNCWNVSPYAWTLWMKKILKECNWYEILDEGSIIPHEESSVLDQLSKLDMEILAALDYKYLTVRQLRKKLQKNMNALVSSIKKLKAIGVLRVKSTMYFSGLNEALYITAEGPREFMLAFLAALNDLPRHNTAITDNKITIRLTSFIYLPEGAAIPFCKAVNNVLHDDVNELKIHFLGPTYGGTYRLPVELYNVSKKRWSGINID